MTKKSVKAIKNKARLKKLAPEELESVWDIETAECWSNLNPKQQDFFIAWLNNGYNASEAHRAVYDKLASNPVAAACGSRRLSSANIQAIARKLSENKGTELLLVKKAYIDALGAETPIFGDGEKIMDLEDHKTRISAAEKLAKLNGELVEKSERKIEGSLEVNQAQVNDMNLYLEKIGQPPIIPQQSTEQPQNRQNTPDIEEEDDPFTSVGGSNMEVIE